MAFAHLIGTAPIQASSGKTNRHRLDRGGHRQGNSDYVVKALALALGKSKREGMRLLKRYAAREIFHILITIRQRHQLAAIAA